MKYLTAILLVLSISLGVGGCSSREVRGTLNDIARGVLIFDQLRDDWSEFKNIAEEEGLSSESAIAAGEALWESAVELRPITYKQMVKHPDLIEYYSHARITLAEVLGKPSQPELTLEEIQAFLDGLN